MAGRGRSRVDWAAAAIGNPDLDVAYALVSVRAEGGVAPELRVPQLAELMSLIAGNHAARLSAPVPTWVRTPRSSSRGT